MAEHATGIDAYMREFILPRLAPLVERVARRTSDHDAPLLARPTVRKVLVFDARARAWGLVGSTVFVYMAGNALVGLGRLAMGDFRGAAQLAASAILAVVAAGVGLAGMAARLRWLSGVLTRCVTVRGRVTSAVSSNRWQPTVVLTIEYPLAGAIRQAQFSFIKGRQHLVDQAPDLLVDADDPPHIFIRNFYV